MFFSVDRLSVSIQSMFFWPSVPNYAPPAHTGRPPDWVWCRLPCFLPPADTHQHWELCPRWSKSCGSHRCDCLAHSGSLLLLLLVKQFDRSAGRLPESGRSLWRVAWTVLTDKSWAWASFMTLSWQSFSTSAVISVMDIVAVKFLWSAAAATHSHISPFDNCL